MHMRQLRPQGLLLLPCSDQSLTHVSDPFPMQMQTLTLNSHIINNGLAALRPALGSALCICIVEGTVRVLYGDRVRLERPRFPVECRDGLSGLFLFDAQI
jgi:hypothetical protein